jgi:LacI family transcriptional regulator
MVTIIDIAKKAGVSVATVSHVLNKSRFVSDKLQDRVNRAIEELDYHPNMMAGSLRSRRTRTIGLIVPDNSNPLFASLSMLIEQVSSGYGYNVMLCNSAYELEGEMTCLKVLRSKSIDGIIIIPVATTPDYFNQLVDNGTPVIILHHIIPGYKSGSVLVDNFKGTYDTTAYLVGLGHRNIGYIDRPSGLTHSMERLKGYKQALKDNGIKIDENIIITSKGFGFREGTEATEELLKKGLHFTALMTFNDIIAVGAMKAITDYGYKVPDNISVVGFDDIDLSSYLNPQLTTVHFPKKKMAEEAVKLLLKKINNPEKIRDNEKKVLPLTLVVRNSVTGIKDNKRK